MNDGRGLNDDQINKIREDIVKGNYDDHDLDRIFQTLYLQRKVLRALFNRYSHEPMRLLSLADPIRNSELAHLKELVSMEDGRETQDLP